ncbi:hypothetical protein [Variovorax saccharolyticus]|uniref:hypothetical protein n=1 Tax=Variovorax saccharolyticus TaxID=3053516 RepID=UPI00257720C0|nr:hypothetical protein [Variovorax sp. J22R187]MDM0019275.1 hypothetical protein [Variovorax sp. J22R187]
MSTILANGLAVDAPGSSPATRSLSHVLAFGLRLLTGWNATAPAAPQSRKAEADAVREWAWTFARTDRSFSDDLFAAADRHERLQG